MRSNAALVVLVIMSALVTGAIVAECGSDLWEPGKETRR